MTKTDNVGLIQKHLETKGLETELLIFWPPTEVIRPHSIIQQGIYTSYKKTEIA